MPFTTETETTTFDTPLLPTNIGTSYAQKKVKSAINATLNIPRTIANALSKAIYWIWENGIQITASYPNGKKDAQNLTAKKVFNQLAGFAFSTFATTLVRLANLAVYVAVASVYFFAVFGLVSLTPVSVSAAAGIAAVTMLTSPFVVSTVLGLAGKAFWEGPSKSINNKFYYLINEAIGNKDKYGSGNEFDYIAKLFHKWGYQASDFVLSLPSKAYRAAFGITAPVDSSELEQEGKEQVNITAHLTKDGSEIDVKQEITAKAGYKVTSLEVPEEITFRARSASEQRLIDMPSDKFDDRMARVYPARAALRANNG